MKMMSFRNFRQVLLVVMLSILAVGCFNKEDKSADNGQLPLSDKIIIGTLDNGLTYYIRENDMPSDKVEIRLNVRSGSLDETEEERGLAHFVEHMAFNGTTHFKGNDVIKFLETVGLTFGQHSNAYTSSSNTNYQLSLPVDNETLLDTAFLILSDWARGITFDVEEVDAEKGVILEELRSRDTAGQRLRLQTIAYTMANSRYLERDPIGLVEVIENATPELLRGYYDKWYRPENMSVVVVGAIDPEQMKSLIVKYFAPFEKSEQPLQPADKVIPITDGLRFAVISDKEATDTSASLLYFYDDDALDTYAELKNFLLEMGAMNMLTKRVSNKILEERSDLISFRAMRSGGSNKNQSIARFNVSSTAETLEADIKNMLLEVESVKRFGFNIDELNEFLTTQKTFLDRASEPDYKYPSSKYVDGIVSYDTNGGHITEFTQDKVLYNKIFNETNVTSYGKMFNKLLEGTSQLVLIVVPESELEKVTIDIDGYKAIVEEVKQAEVTPEADIEAISTLVEDMPEAGKIVSREKYDNVDGELITYDNGFRMFIKKNDKDKNRYEFVANKIGGTNALDDVAKIKINMMPQPITSSGFEGISSIQLRRFMAGKDAKIMITATDNTFDYKGDGNVEDIETMFQLFHSYLTKATIDKVAYDAIAKTRLNALKGHERDKNTLFNRKVSENIYNDNYRRGYLLSTDLDSITVDDAMKIYEDNYLDINNYTMVIVGDVDVEQVAELGAKYLASIKSDKPAQDIVDTGIRFKSKKGSYEEAGQVSNKSSVNLYMEGKDKVIEDGEHTVALARRIISQRLRERIREEMGGVYGISTRLAYFEFPEVTRFVSISFTCDPERKGEILKEINIILDKVTKDGVTQKELDTAKSQQDVTYDTVIEQNRFWVNRISSAMTDGDDILSVDESKAIYQKVTVAELNKFIKEYMDGLSVFTAVFNPEVAKK